MQADSPWEQGESVFLFGSNFMASGQTG